MKYLFGVQLLIYLLLYLTDLVKSTCVTTRHVSGYGNRGGGFVTNDRDVDNLYYNNERCGWEIAVPPGATISFHFIQMELEPPANGECFDWVAIYDGPDQDAPLLVKQCLGGRLSLRRQFHTTQHFGFVFFYSDASRRTEGFRLRWARQAPKPTPDALLTRQRPALAPCSDTRFISGLGVDQNGGYITNDKDSESLYFNGENCGWLISVPADSTIRFYFNKIDLETIDDMASGSDCKFDWVAIYDGLRPSSSLLTKQCSSSGIGKSFYTTQQYAFVRFHTDQSVQYEGFELRWLRQGPKGLPLLRPPLRNFTAYCTGTRTVSDEGYHGGFIANDQGADGLYLNSEHCSWQIRVAKPLTIWLYFTEMELETSESGECFDWVAIYDGPDRNSTLLTKQCFTSALGLNFHTTQQFAFVYFHTDNSQRYKGFKLHWIPQDNAPKTRAEYATAGPHLATTTLMENCESLVVIHVDDNVTEGYIENPKEKATGFYNNNQRCSWLISAPDDSVIRFWFAKIDMEHHDSCWHDWVSIFDGFDNHSRTLTKQCSIRALGKNFTTTGNNGFVQFRTDSSGRRTGFRLRWVRIVPIRGVALSTTMVPSTEVPSNWTNTTISFNTMSNGTLDSQELSSSSTGVARSSSRLSSTSTLESSSTVSPLLVDSDDNSTIDFEPSMEAESGRSSSGMNPGVIAGFVVMAIVGTIFIFASTAFFMQYRSERKATVFYLKSVPKARCDEQVYEELTTSCHLTVSEVCDQPPSGNVNNCGDEKQQRDECGKL